MSGHGAQPVEYNERLGGGRSVRLMAMGVVVVLAGVIAIGVLGRDPAPPPIAQVPASATPTPGQAIPTATPNYSTPRPPDEVAAIRSPSSDPEFDEQLGTLLEVAGSAHYAPLEKLEEGRWYAAYRVPYPRPALEATLELTQKPTPVEEAARSSLGRWEVSLKPMTPEWAQAGIVLDVTEAPRKVPGAHELVGSGFSISVLAESRLYFGVLTVRVQRFEPVALDETYTARVRVGRFETSVDLALVGTGLLSGTLEIPDRVGTRAMELTLVARPAQVGPRQLVILHRFEAPLPWLDVFTTENTVITRIPGGQLGSGEPEVLAYQYRFSAATSQTDNQRAFAVHVQVSRVRDDVFSGRQ